MGQDGLAALRHATDHAEQAINDWKDAEPRIWGHLVSGIYKLLNWKSYLQHLMGALKGADRAAETFFCDGIGRWEKGVSARRKPLICGADWPLVTSKRRHVIWAPTWF